MPERQSSISSDTGLCEHGNFVGACPICQKEDLKKISEKGREKDDELQERIENDGVKDDNNTREAVMGEEAESLFQDIEEGNFDVRKWRNIPTELRRCVMDKIVSQEGCFGMLYNFITNKDFRESDNSIALSLVKYWPDLLIDNRKKFENLNFDNALAERFIGVGRIVTLVRNLEMFHDLNLNSEFVNKIIDKEDISYTMNGAERIAEAIAENLEQFNDLNKEIAHKLIDKGFSREVLNNFDKFPNVDLDLEFANKLVKQGVATELFEKASQMTPEEFVKYVVESSNYDLKFNIALVDNLFKTKDGIKIFVQHLFEKFRHLKLDSDHAYKLIECGFGRVPLHHSDMFPDLIWDADIADRFIKAGDLANLVMNNEKFSGFVLDENMAAKIIKKGEIRLFFDKIDEFSGIENLDSVYTEKILEFVSSSLYFVDFIKNHIKKIPWLKNNELIFKLRELSNNGSEFDKQKFAELEEMFVLDKTLKGKFEDARSAPKDKRSEQMKEFKSDLRRYKEWWAQITKDSIELIRSNPDIEKEELLEWFYEQALLSGFDPKPLESDDIIEKQKFIAIPIESRKVEEIFDKYQKEHGAIKRLRAQFSDDQELYEHLYGSKPEGKIEIIKGASNLHIRCWNLNDYTRVYYGKNKTEKLTGELINRADKSGGVQTKTYFEELKEDIIITAENNKKGRSFKEKWPQEVFVHEEQHAIHELFKNEHEFYATSDFLKKAIKEKDGGEIQKTVERELRRFRHKLIDVRAKDEIMAFYKDGTSAEDVKNILLKTEEDGGIYDYTSKYRENWKEAASSIGLHNEKDDDIKKYFESAIQKVFTEEYKELIDKAVNAFAQLQNLYGTEKTIRLLTHEPLDKWVKVAERIIKSE